MENVTTGCGDCFSPIIMAEVSELRRDVSKSEADIKSFAASEFCDIAKSIGNEGSSTRLALSNTERNLQNNIHEARHEALKTAQEINNRLCDFERQTAENFCEVKSEGYKNTQKVLEQLANDKLDSKNDRINELMHDKANYKYDSLIALQNQELNYLKQMVNSIEQTQKFGTKTVQFGTGNVTTPTQTANQG